MLRKCRSETTDKKGTRHRQRASIAAEHAPERGPGTNAEIKEFCTLNYGVTFPMMSKISVKGDDMDPVYQWLTKKNLNGKMDSEVKWNFQKYLIDEEGNLVDVIEPKENPLNDKILSWVSK